MSRLTLFVIAGSAVLLAVLMVIPKPYNEWFLVATMAGALGGTAVSSWRAHREAGSPVGQHLRRTGFQRHSLWSAAFFAVTLGWAILTDPQSMHPAHSMLFWITSGMIGIQLMTGLPRGKVTETGILVNGRLFRWATLKDPQWLHSEPATLTYRFENPRGQPFGRLELHPADVPSVNAAMTNYL